MGKSSPEALHLCSAHALDSRYSAHPTVESQLARRVGTSSGSGGGGEGGGDGGGVEGGGGGGGEGGGGLGGGEGDAEGGGEGDADTTTTTQFFT